MAVVVIGAGPGGYAAAFAAADQGLNVTLIDVEPNPGGVCLYRGCIPSKALLHLGKLVLDAREAEKCGLRFASPEIDLNKLRAFKDSVVQKLTGGLGVLSKQRKVNYIQGRASFLGKNKLMVAMDDGSSTEIEYENAIIATGSVPVKIPGLSIDSPLVMDSTGALELKDIPERLLVIGGGYIGLEMSSVYQALGSRVSIVEMLPGILSGCDKDLANILLRKLRPRMENIFTETRVKSLEEKNGKILAVIEGEGVDDPEQIFDRVLISIGRRPVTDGLGLQNTEVRINGKGFIETDEKKRTADPSIYAVGDVSGGLMLAHKASSEAKVAVEAILGHKAAFNPKAIPAVVFTDPEIAWTGLTETEARAEGIRVETLRFPWAASGRATSIDRNEGLTKILVEPGTGRILGGAIAGEAAGEMIGELSLAVETSCNIGEIARTIHPHPTLSETIMEAAESYFGLSTHLYRPKRK